MCPAYRSSGHWLFPFSLYLHVGVFSAAQKRDATLRVGAPAIASQSSCYLPTYTTVYGVSSSAPRLTDHPLFRKPVLPHTMAKLHTPGGGGPMLSDPRSVFPDRAREGVLAAGGRDPTRPWGSLHFAGARGLTPPCRTSGAFPAPAATSPPPSLLIPLFLCFAGFSGPFLLRYWFSLFLARFTKKFSGHGVSSTIRWGKATLIATCIGRLGESLFLASLRWGSRFTTGRSSPWIYRYCVSGFTYFPLRPFIFVKLPLAEHILYQPGGV